MITVKDFVARKALDKSIEKLANNLEILQNLQEDWQAELQTEMEQAEALGKPLSEVESKDMEGHTLRDWLQDNRQEIEATRRQLENARNASSQGTEEIERFLDDHIGDDSWRQQTIEDHFGRQPDSSWLEPGSDEQPATEPPEPSTMGADGRVNTLRTGEEKPPGETVKPGQVQPAAEPSPEATGGQPAAEPSLDGEGASEPAEAPGLLSRLASGLADSVVGKLAQKGVDWVKEKVSSVIGMAIGAAVLIGIGGLLTWVFWPNGSPEPKAPEPVDVQAPLVPASPGVAPPNPFEYPQVPQGVPPNPFGGPEPAPPNPYEPQAPPPNPFAPPQAPHDVPSNPLDGPQTAPPNLTEPQAPPPNPLAPPPGAPRQLQPQPQPRGVTPGQHEPPSTAGTDSTGTESTGGGTGAGRHQPPGVTGGTDSGKPGTGSGNTHSGKSGTSNGGANTGKTGSPAETNSKQPGNESSGSGKGTK